MTSYIPTKDVAKLIRAELRTRFPGVKFSVRCGTGTGSAWIAVSYQDGPTYEQAAAVVQAFEGRKFNGMTDSYDDQGTVLIAGTGDRMPEEIRYC